MDSSAVANSLMRLSTTAGEDRLYFRSMSGVEELGHLFEFDVQALAVETFTPDGMLGSPACVTLECTDGSERHFHGLVCALGFEGVTNRLLRYHFVLRPWLWMLTRRTDSRIFQNKTIQDILRAVFQPFGGDYEFKLNGTYEPYVYCVQYRESDFAFISRLMEQEGIYYYFRHERNKHTMVLVDAPQAHPPCPGEDGFVFRDSLDRAIDLEAITELRVSQEIQPGQAVLQDYDFEHPRTSLQVTAKSPKGSATHEHYDYPGEYTRTKDGQRYVALRLQELRSQAMRVVGAGNVRTLATGHTFRLLEHPRYNARYLVVSTRIEMGFGGHESGEDPIYHRCQFTASGMDERFHPRRTTPKPRIQGPQTAVVVGRSSEELWVDAHGRVKVQFHWDRLGKNDENSSCWIRVAHPWAGKGYGMQALPRIGQEVVVEFLEGDPDRPIITGRVHNAEQTPPHKLPDHATVSTIRSHSSLNGADDQFNELRFEDKKGEEHVWFQAQRDYYRYVKNDAYTLIDNDCFHIVKRDRKEEVKRDATQLVEGDSTRQVKGKAHLTIGGDQWIKVDGKQGTKVGMDVMLQAGMDGQFKFGANLAVDAAANVHIKGGANIVIEAGATITLKSAMGGSIVIGPTVSITGAMVNINSGGAPGAGSGVSKTPEAPQEPKALDPPKDPLASG